MEPKPGTARTPEGAAVTVRVATPADAATVWQLLHGLAEFEKLAVTGSPEKLALHLSHEVWPPVDGFLAEVGGEAVGYALYFGTFSSFRTQPMVWLEDLFVRPSHRGTGAGAALFRAVARATVERGCARLNWAVLDWNEPAMEFYQRLGATRQSDWFVYELDGTPLRAAAEAAPDTSRST